MFRSLPSRIQLSEREVYQTLQQVIVERAVRQQLETLRTNEITSDQRCCQLRATSTWSPPSSASTSILISLSSSSSSGIVCMPSDSKADDVLDRNICLLAASSPSPRNSSSPLSFFSADHQIPASLVRARLNVNRQVRVRDRDGRRELMDSAIEDEEDDSGHGSPPEQGLLVQTLPNPRSRIRRVVGSGHHGAFL
ncbi:hypothetical protein PISL3812_09663 [Talaromyces islandicus]|uniref:Uncharacterized protein n=1 Tax=Talaromyces islandicus TaxID=28573 RepID=A0A0U1MC71_TALIS|nr:hypothetical protein PISL3812_09663 [Talaromyces islandicus]